MSHVRIFFCIYHFSLHNEHGTWGFLHKKYKEKTCEIAISYSYLSLSIHNYVLTHKTVPHCTPGWDNDGEPRNQVPTKSSFSTEILYRSTAFWHTMHNFESIWAEKDQINNFLSYYGHSCELTPRLLGRNIWKRPRVPTKQILLSHPGVQGRLVELPPGLRLYAAGLVHNGYK